MCEETEKEGRDAELKRAEEQIRVLREGLARIEKGNAKTRDEYLRADAERSELSFEVERLQSKLSRHSTSDEAGGSWEDERRELEAKLTSSTFYLPKKIYSVLITIKREISKRYIIQ